MESSVCVVFASTACPPSKMAPAGRLTLLSLRADEISNIETPSASILPGSALISTRRSTSPVTSIWRTPSTSDSAGNTRDWTIPCNSAASLSEITLNCMTGNWSGLNRPTDGSSTPGANDMSFTAAETCASAAAMSVPYS